ncbi:NPCBM/NEW2 domain-containing protein [Microbacterium sp. VKM Ac-2923]|uniref:NPCBM/NEW2 domain-containing protein n=1 Tax=Microbacterium sp. VKM Ac-2923 TaxID=2929476 RepID=UPI001FB3202A|nr:NPCBM/NEW2 domain-containing protein [Microbacterium sp. VKM Ac-2923]MCJ1709473.1 NPCBM/NEW2 domain-containing protein [Microbacterium sp. VKM Ac-2923]
MLIVAAVAGAMIVSTPNAALAATSETPLTDLAVTSQTNGWGTAKTDRSLDGRPLTLAGKTYDRGWGTNAPSTLVYELSKQFITFTSDVGIDDEVGSSGRVKFLVYGDGKELWSSTEMTGDSATQTVNVDVTGVSMLRLVVDQLGDLSYDHGDWAGPKLISSQNPIVGFYATKDGSKQPLETRQAVSYGTSASDALATLPTEGFSLFRDGTYFAFRATWAFDSAYDPNTPGDKAVTATITSTSAGGTVMASKAGVVSVLPQSALPAPWSDAKVGDSTTGSATWANGTFTVAGSGSDIWNRQSGFHFAFQRYSGDVQLVARLDSITDTDDWAKAGLMIADGLEADAKFASVLVTPRRAGGLERRDTVAGDTIWVGGTSGVPALPLYLKIVRSGDTITSSRSTDGKDWTEMGSTQVSMKSAAYIGFAVTSHNTTRINTATFSEVSVGPATMDRSRLQAAITQAAQVITQTPVGTAVGGVTQAAVDTFNAAISAARAVDANTTVRQARIDESTNELATALTAFQTSTVQGASKPFISNKDLNGSGTPTVGDLGIASDLTRPGATGSSIADVDNNGRTEAADLSAIGTDIANKRIAAYTPPLGWNSWDVYANTVNEAQLRAHADYAAANLKQYGWQYIVNDIQWYNPQANGSYNMTAPAMDRYGRLLPAENRFPSAVNGAGMKPIADYVHSKGLKFGIHIMRGIPRAAVDAKLPIKGTNYTADQIANKNSSAAWNGDMWGIDASKPGAQEYVDSLLELYAEWEIDFIKIDDLSAPTYHQAEVELYRNAIDKTGRQIVFSTSPGNTPIAAGEHVQDHANMWRMSNDFWDNWPAMLEMYELTDQWTPFRGPGHWPDADMIPIGKLEIRTDPNTGAERDGRMTNFTRDEQISLMTLWSMAKSPLILGNDLRVLDSDPWTKALITNRAVLNVNQTSTDNKLLYRTGSQLAWTAKATDGSTYLSHANLAQSNAMMSTSLSQLGLPSTGRYLVYDLWSDSYLGTVTGDDSVVTSVATHGARLLQLIDVTRTASFTTAPITTTPYSTEVAAAATPGGPAITLTGTGERTVGSTVEVTVSGTGLAGSTAQEVDVAYDPTKLTFGAAAGKDGTTAVNTDASKPGHVRLLLTNPAGLSGTAALAAVTFTVKAADASATASATVSDKSGRESVTNGATAISWSAAATGPKVTATASARCVAGKAAVMVTVTNADSQAVEATATSPWGVRSVKALPAGKASAQVFSTRANQVAAGSIEVKATVEGRSGTTVVNAAYSAISCR